MFDLVMRLGALRGSVNVQLAMEASSAEFAVGLGDWEPEQEEPLEVLDEAVYGDLYGPATAVPRAMAYLSNRRISTETVELLDLRYDPQEERVLFPVRGMDGELYGMTGRSILDEADYPTHYSYPKVRDYLGLQKRRCLLGAQNWDNDKPVFLTEGLLGYATLIEICADEIVQPVACLGSWLSEAQAEILRGWDKPVFLVPDMDPAGDVLLYGQWTSGAFQGGGAIDKLKDHVPVHIPEYPEGKDDVDDFEYTDVAEMITCPVWGAIDLQSVVC